MRQIVLIGYRPDCLQFYPRALLGFLYQRPYHRGSSLNAGLNYL